jgi:hypothetical protein
MTDWNIHGPRLLAAGLQALAQWPLSLRGSPLERAVREAQGQPETPIEAKAQLDLGRLARETFAVPTAEE